MLADALYAGKRLGYAQVERWALRSHARIVLADNLAPTRSEAACLRMPVKYEILAISSRAVS